MSESLIGDRGPSVTLESVFSGLRVKGIDAVIHSRSSLVKSVIHRNFISGCNPLPGISPSLGTHLDDPSYSHLDLLSFLDRCQVLDIVHNLFYNYCCNSVCGLLGSRHSICCIQSLLAPRSLASPGIIPEASGHCLKQLVCFQMTTGQGKQERPKNSLG